MPRVVYVGSDGSEEVVEAEAGETVMSAARRAGVQGILGECGGNQSCGTCHVWVRGEFRDRVGSPGDFEQDMLDLGVTDRRVSSRLGCQIRISGELDGLIVDVPPARSQGSECLAPS